MVANTRKDEPLLLADLEDDIGRATELSPQEKARLTLARWILGAVFFLFIASGVAVLVVPESRITQAQEIFEFIKSFGPPIITLVIGFYFRGEAGS